MIFFKNLKGCNLFALPLSYLETATNYSFFHLIVQKQTTQDRFMQALQPILPNLERFIRAMTMKSTRPSEADQFCKDLLSETIVRAFEKFDSLRNPEALLSYCFTIATRLYRKEMTERRKYTRLDDADQEYLESKNTPSLPPSRDETEITLLYAALDKLPEKQREALIMFEILDFSLKEIHALQGGTMIALKVRLSRKSRTDKASQPYTKNFSR